MRALASHVFRHEERDPLWCASSIGARLVFPPSPVIKRALRPVRSPHFINHRRARVLLVCERRLRSQAEKRAHRATLKGAFLNWLTIDRDFPATRVHELFARRDSRRAQTRRETERGSARMPMHLRQRRRSRRPARSEGQLSQPETVTSCERLSRSLTVAHGRKKAERCKQTSKQANVIA